MNNAEEALTTFARPPSSHTAGLDAAQRDQMNNASSEVEKLFRLRKNQDFQWFIKECLIADADALHEEMLTGKDSELPAIRKAYQRLVEAINWLPRREIVHRQRLNPSDPLIKQIRASLYGPNKS